MDKFKKRIESGSMVITTRPDIFNAGNGNYDRMSKDNSYNLFVSNI